jgi:hypothetical protein
VHGYTQLLKRMTIIIFRRQYLPNRALTMFCRVFGTADASAFELDVCICWRLEVERQAIACLFRLRRFAIHRSTINTPCYLRQTPASHFIVVKRVHASTCGICGKVISLTTARSGLSRTFCLLMWRIAKGHRTALSSCGLSFALL